MEERSEGHTSFAVATAAAGLPDCGCLKRAAETVFLTLWTRSLRFDWRDTGALVAASCVAEGLIDSQIGEIGPRGCSL